MLVTFLVTSLSVFLKSGRIKESMAVSKHNKISEFEIKGNIISQKFLFADHGNIILVVVRPHIINIYRSNIENKDPYWGIYDTHKKVLFFVISYGSKAIERNAYQNIIITHRKKHFIKMNNGYMGNLLIFTNKGPDNEILRQFENKNTIRL